MIVSNLKSFTAHWRQKLDYSSATLNFVYYFKSLISSLLKFIKIFRPIMSGMLLSQEILEHILQFVDGETLLMCREVSEEFAEAVKYLTKTKNIWEQCYFKEKKNYPYSVISKFYPHNEGLNHSKNWGLIYESCLLGTIISNSCMPYLTECKIGKHYSDIQDVETHEDLLFILVKYNKDFSIYYKIITVNLENNVVDKSCRFFTNMLYITSIEDPSDVRADVITLSCDLCQVVAVPVCADVTVGGYPKFQRNDDFLTIEHSNGECLWINSFSSKLLSKGKCFHTGKDTKHEDIRLKDTKTIKVFQGFTSLFISCGQTRREFSTFKDLRANVTASMCYSNLLILGTNTGMLYAYYLNNEADLKKLNLESYIWQYDVCPNSILAINVTELENMFVVVCCSEKSVYQIHISRKLKNFNS